MMNKDQKHPQIKYTGELDLGFGKIKCHVLEDGRRVFETKDFEKLENFLLGDIIKEPYPCKFCGKEAKNIPELLRKIKQQRPEVFLELIKQNAIDDFVCEICDNEYFGKNEITS